MIKDSRAQVLTLEYILLFALVITIIIATYAWSIPVVEEITGNAEINRVRNSLVGLDRIIQEVSHQPGSIRELEIDLGDGSLEIAPPLI